MDGQGIGCLSLAAKKTCGLGKAPNTLLDTTRLSDRKMGTFSCFRPQFRKQENIPIFLSHGARSAYRIARISRRQVRSCVVVALQAFG